jgi:hypothetical protein
MSPAYVNARSVPGAISRYPPRGDIMSQRAIQGGARVGGSCSTGISPQGFPLGGWKVRWFPVRVACMGWRGRTVFRRRRIITERECAHTSRPSTNS